MTYCPYLKIGTSIIETTTQIVLYAKIHLDESYPAHIKQCNAKKL